MFVKIYGAGELKQRHCHVVCAQMLNKIFWIFERGLFCYIWKLAQEGDVMTELEQKEAVLGFEAGRGSAEGSCGIWTDLPQIKHRAENHLAWTSGQVARIGRWKGSWIHEAMNPKHNNWIKYLAILLLLHWALYNVYGAFLRQMFHFGDS